MSRNVSVLVVSEHWQKMLVSVCKMPHKQTLNLVALSIVNDLVLKQSCKKSGLMAKVSLFFEHWDLIWGD